MWAEGTLASLRTVASLDRVWAASERMSDLPKSKRMLSSRVITVPQDSTGFKDSTGGNFPSAGSGSTLGASVIVTPFTNAVPSP